MLTFLTVSVGQASHAGPKPINQDFHGVLIPPLRDKKGITAAISDGISTSEVSHIAAESAVKSFITDYYSTSDAWSVKRSGQRVISAINTWLHGQTQAGLGRINKNQGYVCTLSVLVLRSKTAHIFHVGDTRIYRIEGQSLEQLTTDHRLEISDQENYLSRALGVHPYVDVEYRRVPIQPGDIFVLMTDGVYDHLAPSSIVEGILKRQDNLDRAAEELIHRALAVGSEDNLTLQILRVESVPESEPAEWLEQIYTLPPIHDLHPGQVLDGYTIIRKLYSSHRSHIFLARDTKDDSTLVIKIPASEHRSDQSALERLLTEEWIARRLDNPHLLKAHPKNTERTGLYIAMAYVSGQSLAQWLKDHPKPSLESVRGMMEQIALGLQALHRMEMVHQDIRPDNIMIDDQGTLKIIDFGSTLVGSASDAFNQEGPPHEMLGTEQFSAPEQVLGLGASSQSDIFSMGVLMYFMLSGALPYGAGVARLRHPHETRQLRYTPLLDLGVTIPFWVESAIKRALHPDPSKRYSEISEFIWDLRHPNPDFGSETSRPLIERHPVRVWQVTSLILFVLLLLSMTTHLK